MKSSTDLGTMKCEKDDAHKVYDASKSFFLSFVTSYIVELALHFLGDVQYKFTTNKTCTSMF